MPDIINVCTHASAISWRVYKLIIRNCLLYYGCDICIIRVFVDHKMPSIGTLVHMVCCRLNLIPMESEVLPIIGLLAIYKETPVCEH